MERSDVNEILKESEMFIRSFGYFLPPFAYWTPKEMCARLKTDAAAIREAQLGWDITDYGEGRFDEMGLFLFTVRNGQAVDLSRGRGMLYAEKILVSRKDQLSPMHRHNIKVEDIINRGGGKLVFELYNSAKDGSVDRHSKVNVACDGVVRTLDPGARLALMPGESVTLMPGIWHAFWGEGGDVFIGEVSTVNDDRTDNVFEAPIGRFAAIIEDEAPDHLLVSDYENWI